MASSALPQLNIGDFEPQIFWLLVVFFVFYLIVKVKISPYFFSETESRSNFITNNNQEARKLQKKAERLAVDYNERLQAFHLRANDIVNEAKQDALKRIEDEKNKVNSEMTKKINIIFTELENEFEKTDKKIQYEVSDLFDLSCAKLFSSNLQGFVDVLKRRAL